MAATRKPRPAAKPRVVRPRSAAPRAVLSATEELILKTAEQLFARHGYEAVSTKQLAAEAGLTIGALYHYFPSKDAVYAAAMRHAFAARTVLPQAIRESTEAAERKLARLAAWFTGLIMADASVGRLLQRELLDPRADADALLHSSLFGEAVDLFQDLLRELLPDADPDDALAALLALLFGFANLKGLRVIAPAVAGRLKTPDEVAARATSLLLCGLRG